MTRRNSRDWCVNVTIKYLRLFRTVNGGDIFCMKFHTFQTVYEKIEKSENRFRPKTFSFPARTCAEV